MSGGTQPTHEAIMRELTAFGARTAATLEAVDSRLKEHIVESRERSDKILDKVLVLETRTAVLESHEVAPKATVEPEPKPPRSKLEQIGMWAGLIVGLPTIATVLQALWGAIGHLIASLAEQ